MKLVRKKSNVKKINMMQGRKGMLIITTNDTKEYYQYITKKEASARACGSVSTIIVPDREIYDSNGIDVKDKIKTESPKLIKSVELKYNEGETKINTTGTIEGEVYLG